MLYFRSFGDLLLRFFLFMIIIFSYETFVSVMQVDEGIEYTVYASDLTPIDGGVWEMEEAIALPEAVAQLSGSEISNFVEITDYDMFFEIADMNTEFDVPAELAKLKAAAFESIS